MILLFVLELLTAAIVAQETKYAPIPRSQTKALWTCMAASIIAYLLLRSGWGRTERHAAEQRALGTISNSYYGPRREWISNTLTITGGIIGSMWWGATSWLILVRAMERHLAANGLIDLQISVIVGMLSGGMVGAAAGLIAGELWERLHRHKRSLRTATPAA